MHVADPRPQCGKGGANPQCQKWARILYAVRIFMISSKGAIDLIAWVVAHDPQLMFNAELAKQRGKTTDAADKDLEPQVRQR